MFFTMLFSVARNFAPHQVYNEHQWTVSKPKKMLGGEGELMLQLTSIPILSFLQMLSKYLKTLGLIQKLSVLYTTANLATESSLYCCQAMLLDA